jgi:hypothetical protein
MRVIKAPNEIDPYVSCTLFLAGSIEQGEAVEWQKMVARRLSDLDGVIWNPRREVWDSSWEQDLANADFKEQVEWEWNGLGMADITAFYFDPATKSPITLMELGYVTGLSCEDVIVYCPKGFWRKGNVDVICALNKIPVYETEEEFIKALRTKVLQYPY